MSTGRDGSDTDAPLGRFADALDALMFGTYARAYTWFVRGVVVAFLLLALLNFFTDTSPTVDALTGIVFALFVLTALLQVIALARRLQRGQEAVAESAEAIEETADEVAEAADQVATLSEEIENDAATVERTAGAAKEQAERAKGTADAVKTQIDSTHEETAARTERNGDDAR